MTCDRNFYDDNGLWKNNDYNYDIGNIMIFFCDGTKKLRGLPG